MGQKGCYDDICFAIKASDMPLYKKDGFIRLAKAASYIIDRMAADGEAGFAAADASSGKLVIRLERETALTLYGGRTHPFFELLGYFDEFSFSKSGEDGVAIILTKS